MEPSQTAASRSAAGSTLTEYNDYEAKEFEASSLRYELESQRILEEHARNPVWVCKHCGKKTKENVFNGMHGIMAYCSHKPCEESTFWLRKPTLSYETIIRGDEVMGTLSPKKLAQLKELIKNHPPPADLVTFDWKWIDSSVSGILANPTSREQVLGCLNMFAPRRLSGSLPALPMTPTQLLPNAHPRGHGFPPNIGPQPFPGPMAAGMQPIMPQFQQYPELPMPVGSILHQQLPPIQPTYQQIMQHRIVEPELPPTSFPDIPLEFAASPPKQDQLPIKAATLKLFSQDFIDALMRYSQEMEKHEIWRGFLRNLHGVPLDVLGFRPFFEALAHHMTKAACLVQLYSKPTIKYDHSFTLSFCSARPAGLPRGHFAHRDEANLTINTCIGGKFTGSNLVLSGSKCGMESTITIPQVVGRTVIQNGHAMHETTELQSGFRQNLIAFFHVENSFPVWNELPDDVKAHIFSFASTAAEMASYESLSRSSRQLCREHAQMLWPRRYEASFGEPMRPGVANSKQEFINKFQDTKAQVAAAEARDNDAIMHWVPMKAINAPSMPTRMAPLYQTHFTRAKGEVPESCPIQ